MRPKARLIAGILFCFMGSLEASRAADSTHLWVTLGTQAGPIANPERSQPANLLVLGETAILVDVGDGAVEQLSKVKVPLQAVKNVVISHLHFDHTGGLSALLGLRYQLGVSGVVTVYGPPGTKRFVDGIVASLQPLSQIGSGLPRARIEPDATINVIEIGHGSKVVIQGVQVTSVENTHYTLEPDGTENRHLSLSLRFDMPDRSIIYTGDTGPSEAVEGLAKGANMLVTEMLDFEGTMATVRAAMAGDSQARVDEIAEHLIKHHLTPENIGQMAARAGVGQVVVTHMGPGSRAVKDLLRYKRGIRQHFNGPVQFANDLDSF